MQKRMRIRFSIFVKLLILFIIFIVLVNSSIGFIFTRVLEKGPPGFPDRFHDIINKYIISNIGNPPDTNKARVFSKEFETNIRIEAPALNWTSESSVPDINQLSHDRDFKHSEKNFLVRQKGRPYFINKSDEGYIIITPLMPRDFINETGLIIAVLLIVTILAALLYFSLNWIFGPIKKLSDGVAMISEGIFDHKIEVNRKDELGNLAESINEMKENISNMMKSKESLLIDVSHELRSPLTRIKLANEFIEDKKINSRIREDVKEMELMITELLEMYRIENSQSDIKKNNIDLVNTVNNVVSKYDSQNLSVKSEFKKVEILADQRKIESALTNIIDNAIKYSDGKPVNISIYNDENNKNVCISVKDNGKGIDLEEQKKIFEPFYRIDKSRDKKIKGYGLGLSLVKKIIDDQNGKIEVKSRSGEGTEFIISLPAGINEAN